MTKSYYKTKIFTVLFFGLFLLLNKITLASFVVVEKVKEEAIPKKSLSCAVFNHLSSQEDIDLLKTRKDLLSIDLREARNIVTAVPLFEEEFKTVKELYISNLSFVEQILQRLPESMPSLEVLSLKNSGARSSFLCHLLSLFHLRILDLSGTYVTNRNHVDVLLERNKHLTIYIDSLRDFPFGSIDLSYYEDNPRVEFCSLDD